MKISSCLLHRDFRAQLAGGLGFRKPKEPVVDKVIDKHDPCLHGCHAGLSPLQGLALADLSSKIARVLLVCSCAQLWLARILGGSGVLHSCNLRLVCKTPVSLQPLLNRIGLRSRREVVRLQHAVGVAVDSLNVSLHLTQDEQQLHSICT